MPSDESVSSLPGSVSAVPPDVRNALTGAYADVLSALHSAEPASARLESVSHTRCSRVVGIDQPGWSLYLNQAAGLGLAEPATELAVDDVLAFYGLAPRPFIVAVEPDARPRALAGWIEARGLRRRLLLVRVQRAPDANLAVPGAFRIEDMGTDGVETYAGLAAHGLPAVVARAVASLAGRPGWTHSVAYEGDTAVAAGALFVDQQVATLCWSATHTAHRRRGAHSALIAHRVRRAGLLGCSVAVVELLEARPNRPGDALRNLQRAGFQATQNVRVYVG
jgi:GNAT superfamily N-acetyltransferase